MSSGRSDQPKRRDLQTALDELLEGRAASIARTRAIGCIIGRAKQVDLQSEVTYTTHIAKIMSERGASMVFEQRNVLFTGQDVDITADVIQRLDSEAGLD